MKKLILMFCIFLSVCTPVNAPAQERYEPNLNSNNIPVFQYYEPNEMYPYGYIYVRNLWTVPTNSSDGNYHIQTEVGEFIINYQSTTNSECNIPCPDYVSTYNFPNGYTIHPYNLILNENSGYILEIVPILGM